MYTYDKASKQYAAGRKYAPIGTKITNNVWLTYDQPNDCYVLSYVYSRSYEAVVDGKERWVRATAAERDKYTMHEIARVYPTYTHLLADDSNTARNFFSSKFNCTFRKAKSIKIKGYDWTFFPAKAPYYDRYHGNGDVIHSRSGVLIFPDGTYRAFEAPLVRVHDEEKRRVLNNHIKAVRRMLSLRTKLGAFSNVDWRSLDQDLRQKYANYYRPRQITASNPELVNGMLMSVDPENRDTMLPLLWLARHHDCSWYSSPDWTTTWTDTEWLTAFNNMLDACREGLRRANQTVSYVEHEPQKQGEEDAVC